MVVSNSSREEQLVVKFLIKEILSYHCVWVRKGKWLERKLIRSATLPQPNYIHIIAEKYLLENKLARVCCSDVDGALTMSNLHTF